MSSTATVGTQRTGAEDVHWDLSDLYKGLDDPSFTSDLESSLAQAKALKERYYGKVATLDAQGLSDAVQELERVYHIIYRCGVFAHMMFTIDTADPERGAFLQKAREASAAFSTEILFFRLEWLEVDDERAATLLADPVLEGYRHYLESMRRYKPFVLSEAEEKIITEKTMSGSQAWSRLFEELAASLRVPVDGESVSLEAALAMLYSPDAGKRERVASGITDALSEGLRTRAFVYNTLLLDKSIDDRLRGYPSWISARNLSNEASDESVEALVQAVTGRYQIAHRYYALKARLLGVDKLRDFDRFAPVTSDTGEASWEEARSTVISAYEGFSPIAGQIISEFFDKDWIDAAVTPNKSPGAYCMTLVPERHPYVMMNFTGERRSVLVLAHELGHGLHGYLAGHQGAFNASTPLTLSETASVFGEALTFERLLGDETDPSKRLALITSRLEDTIATVFRQIGINRFEHACHTARREEGELSVDRFNQIWAEVQRDVLGDSVEVTEGYHSWWSYIPHFISSPGYVYAYAYGYLFSLAIYQKYVKERDSMVQPYLDLLRSGGSDSPERLAKIVGIDLSDPGFWAGGLDVIEELVGQAERAAAEIG